MRFRNVNMILFVAVIAPPVCSQQAPKPLAKDQVMEFAKVGMETAKLVKLVQEHGIDFDPTDYDLQALRRAGAQDPVIQALRKARPKPLTKDQVLGLVAQGVPPERAAIIVRQRAVDFLVDDRYVETLRLAGGTDELIAAVREASASVTLTFRRFPGHEKAFYSVAFSPDGKLVASGGKTEIKVWVAATGTERNSMTIDGYRFNGESVAFSPDGTLLASAGSYSGTVELWDVATGSLRRSLSKHELAASYVAFSPDGKLLAS